MKRTKPGPDRPPLEFIFGERRLTECQLRVVSLIRNGLSRKQIADALGISLHTVNTHLKDIYKELRTPNDNALVAWAVEQGFDKAGNLNTEYLFWKFTNLPWPNPDGYRE